MPLYDPSKTINKTRELSNRIEGHGVYGAHPYTDLFHGVVVTRNALAFGSAVAPVVETLTIQFEAL